MEVEAINTKKLKIDLIRLQQDLMYDYLIRKAQTFNLRPCIKHKRVHSKIT